MTKFITADEVLTIRNEVLRNGRLPNNECRFPTDIIPGAFHLGQFVIDELVCIASFHPQACKGYNGLGYQLRGMATREAYRGKGYGNLLVNFAMVYLRGQKINHVWCNARKNAVSFYLNSGFEVISTEFNIAGIGPHYVMYVKIQ